MVHLDKPVKKIFKKEMDRGKTSVASLFIYIFNLMFNNIFSTSASLRAPRVFEFYGCRNVGLWV